MNRNDNRKVGIITFSWGTNYGGILQCYALQEALKQLGYAPEVINYMPRQYDDNIWTFLRGKKFMHLSKYLQDRRKESKLKKFRSRYLNETPRYATLAELREQCNGYDVLVSGSDQVMNDYFLRFGEAGGPSTAYYLDFGGDAEKIAYAVSFGVTEFPRDLVCKVTPLIKAFSRLSARESTGVRILEEMGGRNPVCMPDPTLLHTAEFYDRIIADTPVAERIVRAYILHDRERLIAGALCDADAELISDESLEEWISGIKHSSHVITNSFHGTIFCLQFHVPFSVVLRVKENVGMNDRFYTLLERLNLTERIFSESEFDTACMEFNQDWNEIDRILAGYRRQGLDFLKDGLSGF